MPQGGLCPDKIIGNISKPMTKWKESNWPRKWSPAVSAAVWVLYTKIYESFCSNMISCCSTQSSAPFGIDNKASADAVFRRITNCSLNYFLPHAWAQRNRLDVHHFPLSTRISHCLRGYLMGGPQARVMLKLAFPCYVYCDQWSCENVSVHCGSPIACCFPVSGSLQIFVLTGE